VEYDKRERIIMIATRTKTRWRSYALVALVGGILLLSPQSPFAIRKVKPLSQGPPSAIPALGAHKDAEFRWSDLPQRFNVESVKAVPSPVTSSIPEIQHAFGKETRADKKIRLARLAAVKGNFTHAWKGYKDHAWLHDEVTPLSAGAQDPFGGWAATLVDSLGVWLSSPHCLKTRLTFSL
jgi:mannosyl-oligosaccharide alpha-1,2-mannosidase